MRQTTNYKLPSWDSDDRILRTDFNDLTEKVDSALKSQADSISSLSSQMGGTASSGTVNSLSSKLDQEIQDRKNADTAEATARAQADAAESSVREAALALKGNCQIYYTTYVGDGAKSKTLTFPRKPLLVTIMGGFMIFHAIQGVSDTMCHNDSGYSSEQCAAVWSGNSLTWSGSHYLLNDSGATYYVVALMAADA